MAGAVIVSAVRTPFGRVGGGLAPVQVRRAHPHLLAPGQKGQDQRPRQQGRAEPPAGQQVEGVQVLAQAVGELVEVDGRASGG